MATELADVFGSEVASLVGQMSEAQASFAQFGKVAAGIAQIMDPLRGATERYEAALEASDKAIRAHTAALAKLDTVTKEYEELVEQHQAAADAASQKESAANDLQGVADKTGNSDLAAAADAAREEAKELRKTADALKEKVKEKKGEVKDAEEGADKTAEKSVAAQGAAEGAAPSALGAIAGAVGGAVSAVTAAVGAIQSIISQLQGFVQALNPALIEQFNRALADLQATVGVAFEPIFAILTDTIRQVAGIILPVMESLRPVVEQLTQSFVATLIPQVQLLADMFKNLMPLIQAFAQLYELVEGLVRPILQVLDIFFQLSGFLSKLLQAISPLTAVLEVFKAFLDGINDVFRVLSVIMRAFVETIKVGMITFKPVIDAITNVFKKLIEGIIIAVATIAKFFGASGFLKNLSEGLKNKSGVSAAQPAQLKNFEQVANDITQAALSAGGGGNTKTVEDHLQGLSGIVDKIASGQDKGYANLKEVLERIAGFLENIENAKKKAGEYANKAGGAAKGALIGSRLGIPGALIGGLYGAFRK